MRQLGLTLAGLVLAAATVRGQEPQRFEFVQRKMGTAFRMVLYAPDEAKANAAAEGAWKRVDELNSILSDYDAQSELSRLCRMTDDGAMKEPVKVSDDLWRVLEQSVEAGRLSDGAFDVTVGPYVRMWRQARFTRQLPTEGELAEAKASIGYEKIKLDGASHGVRLSVPRMRLDFGGIAKGYASGEALKVLKTMGVGNALFGAAGDVAATGAPPGKASWTVGVQSLKAPDEVVGYVKLTGGAVSTSGDTYRFVEIAGRRYSHIVDPRSGIGLTHRIGVTTIAPDPTTADWVSTAVSVMGPEKGIAMVEKMPGVAARVVTIDDGGNEKVAESARWAEFVVHPDAGK